MLTRVQWVDAFRRGLLADCKYRFALLEDPNGRLSIFLDLSVPGHHGDLGRLGQ